MKILFLNHNLIWRGTFFRCLGFARELVKCGHHVDLWTVSQTPDFFGQKLNIDGVHVWATPRWGYVGEHDGGYAFIDNAARMIQAGMYTWDIVHAFDHRPNVLLPWLFFHYKKRHNRKGKPCVLASDWCDWWAGGGITTSRRGFSFIDRIEQKIEEGSKIHSEGVSVISSLLYERARQLGIEEKRLLILPSGVPVESFPLLDRKECRQRLGLPEEGPLFGFIGFSLWDLEMLADAFYLIKRQIPKAKLMVIGGGVEDRAKHVFHYRFTIGRNIFMPGVVPFSEVPEYLGACDVQLLPMRNNLANRARIPNKLFDYYASGRPVVVSDVGDAGMYIKHHQTGYAVKEGTEAFAESCVQLVGEHDYALASGNRARKLAEEEFSYSNLVDHLIQFYKQFI